MGALWELPGSSLGALWELVAVAIVEAKLALQLSYLELQPFYGVFLDLRKVFDAMDWERCIMVLEGYGTGPRMIRLIRGFWRNAKMVCRAAGN